jgi:hypothetical protein
MYWNHYSKGTPLNPTGCGEVTLRTNVKHTYAIEEHGDFFSQGRGEERVPLHPDARYHRRKLEVRASAARLKPDHVDSDHFQTVQGAVEKQLIGPFLKGPRFAGTTAKSQTPGPSEYEVKHIKGTYGGYSGYVAMGRPSDPTSESITSTVPGPGHYDVSSKQTKWVYGEFGKGPGRQDSIESKLAADLPGPGSYSSELKRTFLLGTFEKGQRDEKGRASDVPGPMDYRPYDFEEKQNKKAGHISKGFVPTIDDLRIRKAALEPAPHDYGRADMPIRTIGGFIPKDAKSGVNRSLQRSASEPGPSDYNQPKMFGVVKGGHFYKTQRLEEDGSKTSETPGPSRYNVQDITLHKKGVGFAALHEVRGRDPMSRVKSEIPGPATYTLPEVRSEIKAPFLSRAVDYAEIKLRNEADQPLYYDTRPGRAYLESIKGTKMGGPPSMHDSQSFVTPAPDRYNPHPFSISSFGAMRIGVGNGSFAVHFSAPAARVRHKIELPVHDQGGGGPGVCRMDGAFGNRAHAFPKLPSPDKVIMRESKQPPPTAGPGAYDVDWHTMETKWKQLQWKDKGIKKAKIAKARVSLWKWRAKNLF